ncbi:MAG: hypothetical protein QOC56_440 [Alphaproteobacteria bacterium]|nr:hypothetical protein [Alphaproteobacteria bacterium]
MKSFRKRVTETKAPHERVASAPPPPPDLINNAAKPSAEDGQFHTGDFSLHALFQTQAMTMLDRADISHEEKQNILVAMSCPCCGAGGLSFTAKLKRRR